MNILTDALPVSVQIDGREYAINSDFRAGVEFEMMIEQGEKDVRRLLDPFFTSSLPADLEGALREVELFFCCGTLPEKAEKSSKGRQAYSFRVDAEAVFADFWRYYGIDLSREYLHWWVFRALLGGLPDKSEFKQRVYYRTCSLKGLQKKERERIMAIRSRIEIKDKTGGKLTLEERNAAMLAYVAKRASEIAGGEKIG
jgi:hypothetical protein